MGGKLTSGRGQRTKPLIWVAAFVCVIVTAAAILASVFVLVFFAMNHPRLPSLRLSSARLFFLDLTKPSFLRVRLALTLTAENRNIRVHAVVTGLRAFLRFRGSPVAELRAAPFEVPKNGTKPLEYLVEAAPVPVGAEAAAAAAAVAASAVGGNGEGTVVGFVVEGKGKASWRVGGVVTVKLWSRFRCEVGFFTANGSCSGLVC